MIDLLNEENDTELQTRLISAISWFIRRDPKNLGLFSSRDGFNRLSALLSSCSSPQGQRIIYVSLTLLLSDDELVRTNASIDLAKSGIIAMTMDLLENPIGPPLSDEVWALISPFLEPCTSPLTSFSPVLQTARGVHESHAGD